MDERHLDYLEIAKAVESTHSSWTVAKAVELKLLLDSV